MFNFNYTTNCGLLVLKFFIVCDLLMTNDVVSFQHVSDHEFANDLRGWNPQTEPPCPNATWRKHLPFVIISGIGDSGTRGVAQAVKDITGHQLCGGGVRALEDCELMRIGEFKQNLIENSILAYTLNQHQSNLELFPNVPEFDYLPGGFKHSARFMWYMCEALNFVFQLNETQRAIKDNQPWGFKQPEHWQLLPLWKHILGGFDGLRYIHVIRDGHDVAFGGNKSPYIKYCQGAASKSPKHDCQYAAKSKADSDEGIEERMLTWAKLNAMTVDYLEYHANETRNRHPWSMVVRIEDLVLDPRQKRIETLDKLSSFINSKSSSSSLLPLSIQDRVRRVHNDISDIKEHPERRYDQGIVKAEMNLAEHKSSYGGEKYHTLYQSKLNSYMSKPSPSTSWTKKQLQRFGYDSETWLHFITKNKRN
jgi:hypothetical protein